jgi:putative peptidoglycan lipid II flippase
VSQPPEPPRRPGNLPPGYRPPPPPDPRGPDPRYADPRYNSQPPYGQPQHGQPPYGQPSHGQPSHGQPPYGQPQQAQPPYGEPSHSQPSHSQPGHGQPYGQQYGPPPNQPPDRVHWATPQPPDRPLPAALDPRRPTRASRRPPRRPPPQQPAPQKAGDTNLVRSSKTLVIASLVSRMTGFIRTVAITAAIGATGLAADAYNTSNTLPNIVYELLLGGVLTSVVVPLLVHSQERDADGGDAYAQRLLSLMTTVLIAATALAILGAPILTWLYNIRGDAAQVALANTWARLLLPEIVFYGIGAMLGAVLNARGLFSAPAWAPVLNNVVVIGTAVLFLLLPGPNSPTPSTITHNQVYVLGIGTTLGIVVQALILIPALRQARFRWRWRWDWAGAGLGEARRLGGWVLAYVAVSQVGYTAIVALANHAGREGGIGSNVYALASLLFQMPYGVLGVALLTVLMPRLSRSAVRRDLRSLVSDLSLGTRLTVVALVPVSALMYVTAFPVARVFFAHGASNASSAAEVGKALAASLIGLVPFAVTMLQIRVFYAVRDAKTPTIINLAMVIFRLVLCVIFTLTVPPRDVVAMLSLANGLSFAVGAFLGTGMLRRRFGPLGLGQQFRVLVRITVASLVGMLMAEIVHQTVVKQFGFGFFASFTSIVGSTVVGGGVILVLARAMHIREVDELVGTVRGRFGR